LEKCLTIQDWLAENARRIAKSVPPSVLDLDEGEIEDKHSSGLKRKLQNKQYLNTKNDKCNWDHST
jgi:hypothetical protein